MRMNVRNRLASIAAIVTLFVGSVAAAAGEEPASWPPELKGAKEGTVTLRTRQFLIVPEQVEALRQQEGTAPFIVAETPPTVELAYHRDLGPDAVNRRLWSSWGDIGLARDGRVYSAIGDHADDAGGDARCFLYCWDPERKVLEQVVDMNAVVPPREGQPAWSKVHAKIDEGPDGKIYFSCTLNDGKRAGQANFRWNDRLPGGQLYRYDPETGETVVFADLPPKRCTATSLLDRERNVWWCNLEAGDGDALWCLDLDTRQPVFEGPDGSVAFNRAFGLAAEGAICFNGEGGIRKWDAGSGRLVQTNSAIPDSPGMRAVTRESRVGFLYVATQRTGQLFRYSGADDELTLLGPTWGEGEYTVVMELSPDERFLYYLPGAHGGAFRSGTPVVQYEIATGTRKVLAFLAPAFEQRHGFVPAGTYGIKLSADGETLYVNFNGHATDGLRPERMRANGFGLCGFAAIHVPGEER
jgi:hypothetical protein